jgi:hypothetical protein
MTHRFKRLSHSPLEECTRSPVGSMDTPWIMFFSKREKVPSPELFIELESVPG